MQVSFKYQYYWNLNGISVPDRHMHSCSPRTRKAEVACLEFKTSLHYRVQSLPLSTGVRSGVECQTWRYQQISQWKRYQVEFTQHLNCFCSLSVWTEGFVFSCPCRRWGLTKADEENQKCQGTPVTGNSACTQVLVGGERGAACPPTSMV